MARTKQGMKEARIKRQIEEQEDNDDAPSCSLDTRQRRGISKSTVKRTQNSDETEAKQAAGLARQTEVQEQRSNKKQCPTCLSNGNHEASKTHSRSSSRLCPYQKLRQSVVSRRLLGGKSRCLTIKHGLEGILKTLRTDEKVIFTSGLQKVVDFCRRLKIRGHLFVHYYFTLRLVNGQSIPLVLFDYRFVNGVYQLLVGRKWSNITLFDETLVTNVKTAFDNFKILAPNAICPLMTPMVSKKSPIAFSSITAS
ncbi:hypothetical protein, partial, partial [Absidia glauca]